MPFRVLLLIGFVLCANPAIRCSAQEVVLHTRIDAAVESIAVGPMAPVCSDADFLRRVFLDLAGVIPTSDKAREFLTNQHPNKRALLIDELLDSPEFVRHMTTQLDVMLLERRTDKNVPEPEWERYLVESLTDAKPLDQLYREFLFPVASSETGLAAAKFLLNREAEPNAVTRDIGRLAFGMDLQCAQCHDHPLVGDYFQADYYGLFAFVNRTSLFTDPASKKVRLAEKAEGVTGFKSVFTGLSRDNALPRLPKGATVFDEPEFPKDDGYSVKPQKNVPGVPKFSRREALAQRLAENRLFRRNLANRLWAMMTGRGIVHPVDYHHSANPPANPELLSILADELAAGGFQIRDFLRQVMLSRTYQRSCETPEPETVNFTDIAARGERLQRANEFALAAMTPLKESLAAAQTAFNDANAHNEKLAPRLAELRKKLTDAQGVFAKAKTAHDKEVAAIQLMQDQAGVLADVLAQTESAAAEADSETVLIEAAAVLSKHGAKLNAALVTRRAKLVELSKSADAEATVVAAADKEFSAVRNQQIASVQLASLEHTLLETEYALSDAQAHQQLIDRQLSICRLAADYSLFVRTDPAKADAAWHALVEQWTINGQVSSLQPLTPEQFAGSAMRATGMLDPQFASVKAKVDKTPPKMPKDASEADKARLTSIAMQTGILDLQRTNVRDFVKHYGGLPGEDFQATVNQALFFGNSSVVDGWLKPFRQNLTAKLSMIEDSAAVADEIYLAVYSRTPSDAERQEVADLCKGTPEDRQRNLAELIWAMLSATEFRFNH